MDGQTPAVAKPQVWEVDDPETGHTVEFDWDRPTPPTDADFEAVLKEYRASQPKTNTVADAIRATPGTPATMGISGAHALGAVKGLGQMITGGGDWIRKHAPSLDLSVDTGDGRENLKPVNDAEVAGAFVGRNAVAMIPSVRAGQAAAGLTATAPAAVRLGAQMLAGAGSNVVTGQ